MKVSNKLERWLTALGVSLLALGIFAPTLFNIATLAQAITPGEPDPEPNCDSKCTLATGEEVESRTTLEDTERCCRAATSTAGIFHWKLLKVDLVTVRNPEGFIRTCYVLHTPQDTGEMCTSEKVIEPAPSPA